MGLVLEIGQIFKVKSDISLFVFKFLRALALSRVNG